MSLSRPCRLAYLALALGFCFSWVNLTSPGAFVCTVAESAPGTDDDSDRDIELAAPSNSSRQAPSTDPVGHLAQPSHSLGALGPSSTRATRDTRTASAEPLGSRLRC